LIFEVSLKMSVRAKQAHFSHQKSTTINHKSIPSAGNFNNLTEPSQIHVFKSSSHAYNQPLTNHQSPITNHQSPITNHQSPITNHQSPMTADQ
jgi:hypothetical protein